MGALLYESDPELWKNVLKDWERTSDPGGEIDVCRRRMDEWSTAMRGRWVGATPDPAPEKKGEDPRRNGQHEHG